MVEADNFGAMLLGLEDFFKLLSYFIGILLRDVEGHVTRQVSIYD